jgi:uncharacterized protein YggE
MPMMRAMAASVVSTPIESGQVTVPASVSVTYAIE